MVALALAFVIESWVVAMGWLHGADRSVNAWGQHLWTPGLEGPLRFIALFGGFEVTLGLSLVLFVWLRRNAFRAESWALAVFPVILALEGVYKRLVHQVGPPFAHADGPSISIFFSQLFPYSFPSGHQVRTVFVYGLLAFVIHRLAAPGRLRAAVYPAFGVMIAVMAADRILVEAHWVSDVVGGLLLGGAGLSAAIAWLDVPRVRE